MKVVFLARRFWPAVGGVERHVEFLSQALLQLRPDIELTVVTELHDEKLALQEVHEQIQIHRVPMTANVKASIWTWIGNHSELLKQADIVHVHDVFFWLQPLLPILQGPKVFMTFHGYEPPGPPTWKQRATHQFAELFSERNICVGGFHSKWYGVDPSLITFGAVAAEYTQAPRVMKKNSDKKKLLFVGRLENDTGVWSYLEAIAELPESERPKLQLDVFGEGSLRNQLEWFVEQNKLPVKLHGAHTVTAKTYQGYDVSLVSGYLSILESMAVGLPVIATYSTKLKEDYLRMSPFSEWISIVSPGAELSTSLIQQHKLPSSAREWAQNQTWEKLAKQYLTLWHQ